MASTAQGGGGTFFYDFAGGAPPLACDDLFDGVSRSPSHLATVRHYIDIPKNNRALSLLNFNDVDRLGHILKGKATATRRNVTNHDLELVSMFIDSVHNDRISAGWFGTHSYDQ